MRIGFPHSEICGSKSARLSSQLIAACYVLHRLCVPRHPPDALALTLDRSAFRSMPRKKASEDCSPRADRLSLDSTQFAISLGVFRVNRSCNRLTPPSQCQKILRRHTDAQDAQSWSSKLFGFPSFGHAAYSSRKSWWSRSGSNRRPEACKATALPTELRPRIRFRIRWWARNELNVRPHAY